MTSLDLYKVLFMAELLACEYVYAFRLKRRNRFALRAVCCAVLCLIAAAFAPIFLYNAIYVSGLFLVLFFVTLCSMAVCYNEPLVNILFCGIAAYTTRHLAFQFYNFVSSILGGADYAINGMYSDTRFDLTVINIDSVFNALVYIDCYFVTLAAMFAIFARKLWRIHDLKLKNTSLFLLVGCVLLVDIFINAIAVYNGVNDLVNTMLLYLYNILCCLLILYMQFGMVSMKEMKKELDIVSHMWQTEREQYTIAKENIDLINLKCHDLKYKISNVGRSESISEKSISEIADMINIYDSTVETGSKALDVILTEKSFYCRSKNITLTCMADGAAMSFMDDTDIYALIGNLVDNAVEAVMKLSDTDKRVIGLNVHAEGNFLFIEVHNYYDGNVIIGSDGSYVTTKSDKKYHGFGMRSMRMTVDRYGGDFTASAKKDVFDVVIMIPIPDKH